MISKNSYLPTLLLSCQYALLLVVSPVAANTEIEDGVIVIDLPGIDIVGFGYDARYILPQEAMRQRVLTTFTFEEDQLFSMEECTEPCIFAVPDQVLVRILSSSQTNTYIYDSSMLLVFVLKKHFQTAATSSYSAVLPLSLSLNQHVPLQTAPLAIVRHLEILLPAVTALLRTALILRAVELLSSTEPVLLAQAFFPKEIIFSG